MVVSNWRSFGRFYKENPTWRRFGRTLLKDITAPFLLAICAILMLLCLVLVVPAKLFLMLFRRQLQPVSSLSTLRAMAVRYAGDLKRN